MRFLPGKDGSIPNWMFYIADQRPKRRNRYEPGGRYQSELRPAGRGWRGRADPLYEPNYYHAPQEHMPPVGEEDDNDGQAHLGQNGQSVYPGGGGGRGPPPGPGPGAAALPYIPRSQWMNTMPPGGRRYLPGLGYQPPLPTPPPLPGNRNRNRNQNQNHSGPVLQGHPPMARGCAPGARQPAALRRQGVAPGPRQPAAPRGQGNRNNPVQVPAARGRTHSQGSMTSSRRGQRVRERTNSETSGVERAPTLQFGSDGMVEDGDESDEDGDEEEEAAYFAANPGRTASHHPARAGAVRAANNAPRAPSHAGSRQSSRRPSRPSRPASVLGDVGAALNPFRHPPPAGQRQMPLPPAGQRQIPLPPAGQRQMPLRPADQRQMPVRPARTRSVASSSTAPSLASSELPSQAPDGRAPGMPRYNPPDGTRRRGSRQGH